MHAPKNFKTLTPKDIARVLTKIGVHPAVTPETLEKPNCDQAITFFQCLAELAYNLDVCALKSSIQDDQVRGLPTLNFGQVQVEGLPRIDHPEIYDEAIDVLAVFGLSRQLMTINGIDDFCLRDMWDPQAKKLRASLSAMINFCRYRESKMKVIAEMKEREADQQKILAEVVEQGNAISDRLQLAQVRHSEEVQQTCVAENEVQAAQVSVEKLHKTQQQANSVLEDVETRLAERTRQIAEQEQRASALKEQVASLQEQIAESPEGLEQEIRDLQLKIGQQKARVQEHSDEKRARAQRVQTFGRLLCQTKAYGAEVDRLSKGAASEAAAAARAKAARGELRHLQQALEASQSDDEELERAVRQAKAEIEELNEEHQRRVQDLEARRQQSLQQHQELQAKRMEEHGRQRAMQTQRMELEAEIARVRHAHAMDVAELCAQLQAQDEQDEQYNLAIEGLLSPEGRPAASPAPVRKHLGGASPYPSASPASVDKRGQTGASLFWGVA